MINLSDLKISNVEAFLFSFRQTWDLHLETREETVAESEREAAASTMAAMAMAAATGWNFGISRLSRGRHGGAGVPSFVLQGNDIQRFSHRIVIV